MNESTVGSGRPWRLRWPMAAGAFLVAAFVFPTFFERMGIQILHGVMPGRPTAHLGPDRPQDAPTLMAGITALQTELIDTIEQRKPLIEDQKSRLEGYLDQGLPYEVRGRAFRIGHLLGRARLRPHVRSAFSDPSPQIRRMAIGCAMEDDAMAPADAPAGLAGDPDPGVRSYYEQWVARFQQSARHHVSRDPNSRWLPQATGETGETGGASPTAGAPPPGAPPGGPSGGAPGPAPGGGEPAGCAKAGQSVSDARNRLTTRPRAAR